MAPPIQSCRRRYSGGPRFANRRCAYIVSERYPLARHHLPTREAKDHRFVVPSRDDVADRILALIQNPSSETRDAVADWANEYVMFDDPEVYPAVSDPVVW